MTEGERTGWVHDIRWASRLAWRDSRGAKGKGFLYALSMALGIATLVALGSFGADMRQALAGQTKNLLGADLVVYSRQPFSETAQKLLTPLPGRRAETKRFGTMAHFPKTDQAVLSRIRAMGDGFPFYGEILTEPADAAATYQQGPRALVDAVLLERVGAQVGEEIRLGQQTFTIHGKILETPGVPPAASVMGPRVYISLDYVAATGLLQQGSRVFYSYAYQFPDSFDGDAWVETNKKDLRTERLSWSTVNEQRQQIGDDMDNLTAFLSLTALLTLLLGGLGVAGAVHYHVQQKTRQIGVLRCLGATVRQVVIVYMIQVMTMTLFAVVVGVAVGLGLQLFLPALIREFFPVAFEPSFQGYEVLLAAGWGFLLSFLLALAPLVAVRRVSPLVSFRAFLNPPKADWLQYACYGAVILIWLVFAVMRTGSFQIGGLFLLGLIAAVGILYLTARLLAVAARRVSKMGLPFTWRHGVASLFRPQNQTLILMVILGMGIFLIAVLGGARTMLIGQFSDVRQREKPNFIAWDIQVDQLDSVLAISREMGVEPQNITPIVPMRIEAINGKSIGDLLATDIPHWALRREYRSSYRAELGDSEKVIEGEFTGQVAADIEVVPISLEQDIAADLQVALGDRLTLDVMGIPLETEITSIRDVEWQSMAPNFFIIFPAGILEAAPQMFMFNGRTQSAEQVADLQRAIIKNNPNVMCVDLTQMVKTFDGILDKAATMVQFLAGLCMLTGLVLLGSALWNSRYQRMGEHALLRTLGAQTRQVAWITLTEYLLLGLLASLTGVVLAVIANWALGLFLFKVDPFPQPLVFLVPCLTLPPLTLLLGYLSHRDLWRTPAIFVLRGEN
ncbi:FtsX-like permease family protein [Acanthopleuribacter pedis]|uniref:FtsX-like permease family protein n=1 Tax=Acanthopleuribacter pedis TaxID=442870 RepID=A0A8J7QJU3_9BACT|nr:FtsX-like permease family protein [Acanthopleuribacter pedis]